MAVLAPIEAYDEDPEPLEESELVARAQSGDRRALEALYHRTYPGVLHLCLGRLRDRTEAEEAAAEALCRAIEFLPRLQGERRFGAWARVVAVRLCTDRFRARTRVVPLEGIEDRPDGGESPEECAVRRDELRSLSHALRQLNPRHREALMRREVDGASYAALADKMDTTLAGVESLLHRARTRLAEEFRRTHGPLVLALPALARVARWVRRHTVDALPSSSMAAAVPALAVVVTVALGASYIPSHGAAPDGTVVTHTGAVAANAGRPDGVVPVMAGTQNLRDASSGLSPANLIGDRREEAHSAPTSAGAEVFVGSNGVESEPEARDDPAATGIYFIFGTDFFRCAQSALTDPCSLPPVIPSSSPPEAKT
ncbi:MAG: sigma-70 family RNA polymerase sigma factor [Actinomycetota bacterium]